MGCNEEDVLSEVYIIVILYESTFKVIIVGCFELRKEKATIRCFRCTGVRHLYRDSLLRRI